MKEGKSKRIEELEKLSHTTLRHTAQQYCRLLKIKESKAMAVIMAKCGFFGTWESIEDFPYHWLPELVRYLESRSRLKAAKAKGQMYYVAVEYGAHTHFRGTHASEKEAIAEAERCNPTFKSGRGGHKPVVRVLKSIATFNHEGVRIK